MARDFKIAWFIIVFGVGIAIALALLSIFGSKDANANAPSLVERLVAVQPTLASKKDEPVDPVEFAEAISSVPKVNRDWAALLLTIAGHESALSRRIADGRCRTDIGECDHGLASGLFQAHKNKFNAATWGSTDVRVQTLDAAAMMRRAFYTCNRGGGLRPDWVARTINAYAGHSCDAVWPGLEARLATFKRVRARL